MANWGNTPVELVERVEDLRRLIGDKSYSATRRDNHGRLEIAIHLADWQTRSRLRLFWEAAIMLWKAITALTEQHLSSPPAGVDQQKGNL